MHENDVRDLDSQLHRLVAAERKGLVDFLRTLDRFDREDGPARLHCRSLWDYLERTLHLSAPSVARRIRALHLVRSLPEVEVPLEDGRLNLTTLEVLGRVATRENVSELIGRFAFRTKREAEELEVEIQPREAPKDGIRKLPERSAPLFVSPPLPVVMPEQLRPSLADSLSGTSAASVTEPPPVAPPAPPVLERPEPRGAMEPVAKGRWSLRITLDATRKRRLKQLRDLLSHKVPSGDLNALFDERLDCAIEKHGKRRGAVKPERTRKPTALPPATPGQRAPVRAWVRREVYERDGGRCTHMSPEGQRCESTWQLELDHVKGALVTGTSTPDELTIRCRIHNQLRARDVFGGAHVGRRIREGRRRRREAPAARAAPRLRRGPGP